MTTLQKQIKATDDKINEFRSGKGFEKIKDYLLSLKGKGIKISISDDFTNENKFHSLKYKKEINFLIFPNKDGSFQIYDQENESYEDCADSNKVINSLKTELKFWQE